MKNSRKSNKVSNTASWLTKSSNKAPVVILVLCFLFIEALPAKKQTYPSWFLDQTELNTNAIVVVMSKPYYADSISSYLKQMASFKFLHQRKITIKGSQGYVGNDAGVMWAKNDIVESLDTAKYGDVLSLTSVLDYQIIGNDVFGLIAIGQKNNQALPPKLTKRVPMLTQQPQWTTQLPKDSKYYYALGVSTGGYYESSGWDKAEQNARIEHAKQKSLLKTKSMQKVLGAGSMQEVGNVSFAVTLDNIQFVKRWKNQQLNIYFVLSKIPID